MQIRVGRVSLLLLMPFFVAVCVARPRGYIIMCAGDSITAEAYPHYLQRIFNRQDRRVKVLNFGRSGNTSGEYLSYLADREGRLREEHPDFILLQLGTNDVREDVDGAPAARFTENMRQILKRLAAYTDRAGLPARIFLATIPPVPEGTPFPFSAESARRVREEINPAIRALARESGAVLVDNTTLFEREPGLLPGVHPTREGYRRLAANWAEALRPLMKK